MTCSELQSLCIGIVPVLNIVFSGVNREFEVGVQVGVRPLSVLTRLRRVVPLLAAPHASLLCKRVPLDASPHSFSFTHLFLSPYHSDLDSTLTEPSLLVEQSISYKPLVDDTREHDPTIFACQYYHINEKNQLSFLYLVVLQSPANNVVLVSPPLANIGQPWHISLCAFHGQSLLLLRI